MPVPWPAREPAALQALLKAAPVPGRQPAAFFLTIMKPLLPRLLFAGFLLAANALGLGAAAQPLPPAEGGTAQVRATLLAYAPQGVPIGGAPPAAADDAHAQQVWVGLRLAHAPHWHTYWKNPGDSGLPTELQWTLPPGVTAGDIAWPVPRRIPIGELVNYGYEGEVLLPVPLTITPAYQPGPLAQTLDIKVHAQWLACEKECIPQEADLGLKLPLRGSTALHGAAFEQALQQQPAPLQGTQSARIADGGKRLALRISGLPPQLQGLPLQMMAETPGVLLTAAAPAAPGQTPTGQQWQQQWDGPVWTANWPVAPDRMEAPTTLPLVLASADGKGWRAQATIEGAWPASDAPAAAGLSPALEAALQANAAGSAAPAAAPAGAPATLVLTLLGALLGGMILNLMPCVFPVLAIKVMDFAAHGQNTRAHRAGGLAYTLGVVLSFAALGALMLGLRAAGQQLGWGFQLQSPLVVAALAVLFTVIGLNLAGLFEFGSFVPSGLATLQSRHPTVNAFLSGVLAVAVASPCTAPFMGASLGLAISLPPVQAMLVFLAIGLGMALPYLAASWLPAVARLLPRPGAWMEVFKHFMAFPMFGTVAWLLWVLGQQTGIDGAAALLALLVALALLLWALGLRGRTRQVVGGIGLALGAWLLLTLGPNVTRLAPEPGMSSAAASTRWAAWSPEKVQATLAEGRPVFVDYTAAWCVTCQYNKKTTLASAEVLNAFDKAGVQTLRADWTRRDPAISADLQRLGRNGVPVYVLHAPGKSPVVMTEILSVAEVLQALAQLGQVAQVVPSS